MKFAIIFALALAASAAEPDWTALEKYSLDLLQRYIRIQTVNPPADSRPAAALLRAEFEKHGFTVKLFEAGPAGQVNLLTRLPGRDRTKKPLLLLNHMDVVPVDPKAWSIDPFGGILRDGSIWGRGALDMKGIGIEQLTALVALKQAGITPERDIIFLSTADEESGGELGAAWMINNHWPEIESEYVIDEGGVVSQDMLADKKLVFGVTVGEKQNVWLRMKAKGTAAHGSQPIPDNANMTLLRAIEKAMALPSSTKPSATVAEMQKTLGQMAKNKFTAAIQGNTMTLTTLRSGVGDPPKVNVIPSAAEVTFDCRLLPGTNAEEFISELKARVNDAKITVERLSFSPDPGASNHRTSLYDVIAAAARKHHPSAVVTPILVPWSTDAVKFRMKGVTAYGVSPMVLDSATMATMHSDEERIPIDQFHKGTRIFFDILRSSF
ncbi:MAG TPA: M20/M25/M40 family metallo-hydrolase [Bryobacteraceae bacterium]|nr:M20/M25/M40 family metallo-hydrolase [Bryobacteraceae bacterium]